MSILDFTLGSQVYLACGVTDLRRSINGLAIIVKLQFNLDPYSRAMFVFCNRSQSLIKQKVGHEVPHSTIYRVLKRQGWRKIMPRSKHPKSKPEEFGAYKKNHGED